MLAIVYAPHSPNDLQLGAVPEPEPADDQLVIAVRATSLNFGEVVYMAERQQAGHVAGNDSAGVVLRAAADGSGPPVGTRVAGFSPAGAWAQRHAVATSQLTVLPDSVDLASAAALPAAATTALRAVEKLGPIIGRRVLVTGASGGVGRFAVQLAALRVRTSSRRSGDRSAAPACSTWAPPRSSSTSTDLLPSMACSTTSADPC